MSVQVTTVPTGVRLSAGMTCPRCEASMVIVSSTPAMSREWKAVLRCVRCRSEQLLWVRLLDVATVDDSGRTPPSPGVCGTDAGYHAHRRRDEPACDGCLDAHRAYEASRAKRRSAA